MYVIFPAIIAISFTVLITIFFLDWDLVEDWLKASIIGIIVFGTIFFPYLRLHSWMCYLPAATWAFALLLFIMCDVIENIPPRIEENLVLLAGIFVVIGIIGFLILMVFIFWGGFLFDFFKEITTFLNEHYTIYILNKAVKIPRWIVLLLICSGIIGIIGGLLVSGSITTSIVAGLISTFLPIVGIILFLLSVFNLINFCENLNKARFQRWEDKRDRMIKEGLAKALYRCGVCGKSVTDEDVKNNTCHHCGVHWNRHLWENPPRELTPPDEATAIWLVLAMGFVFGYPGIIISSIILLIKTVNSIRVSSSPWVIWPFWVGVASFFVVYRTTLFSILGPVGLLRLVP